MPTLEQLISQKLNRLETIPNHLITKSTQVQETILKEILKDLEALETKGGKILLTNKNLIQIDVIGNKLQTILFEGEYIEAVRTFSGEFPKQAVINKGIFDASFGTFTDKAIYASVLKSSQKTAINTLASTAIDNVFIDPLKAQLNLAVTGESGIATTANSLREFIIGGLKNGEIIDGTLERHVKQVSHDAFAVSDREYTQAISKDLGVEFQSYSGGLIKTSRCFCVDRNGKIFHNKEIEEWGRMPNLWGKTGSCKGGGRAEGTNEQTIFSLLGGYNCLHSLIPMPTEAVPDDVIARAISKGYYKAA